jgi:phospholipid/cholesterol/gamma-HCH transport system substrate-binding protein
MIGRGGPHRSSAARFVALLALAASVVVAFVVIGPGSGTPAHTLRAAFDEALQVVPGQDVRVGGRKVGEVQSVKLEDGNAVVELGVDNAVWPLHSGTVAQLRFGAAAAYALRYVDISPGPARAPELPDGGVLDTAHTVTPVEFDQMYRIFGPRTRKNFQGLLHNAANTLDGYGGHIGQGLQQGGPGLDMFAGFLGDLGADPAALNTLVDAGSRTAAALRRRDADLRGLISGAAATFDELARHARDQQATLEDLPAALRSGQGTLARTDRTLVGLQGLIGDLRPGAIDLRRLAPSVSRTLVTLQQVAPLATATLRTGERAAPDITAFLRAGTPFLPELGTTLTRLAPMIGCVRAYAPEIAGFVTSWTGFQGNYDKLGHFGRASEQKSPIPVGTTDNSATLVGRLKDRLFYAFPRPPGMNVGNPWFLPACGITRDALDPAKDPEAKK